ncbi:MAG: hypothetical protein KDK08_26875 [Rhizobiaceae bacterium]|nr:hypothetical protein [Rhizobiaceae bacterium]
MVATLSELGGLVEAHTDTFQGIAAAYEALLYGVPSISGFTYLINNAVATNYGSSDPTVEFNRENIFINIANALVAGNEVAQNTFGAIIGNASTLSEKILAIYEDLSPPGWISEEGRSYLTRPEALAFYEGVAAERGMGGPDGAAIVAMASMLDIMAREDWGLGDAINDLTAAVQDGSAELPRNGSVFTPIGVADGFNYDGGDPEPAEPIVYWLPAEFPSASTPEIYFYPFTESGRYADQLDLRAFTGETEVARITASEIGEGDGFQTDANVVVLEADRALTSENLLAFVGREPTDLQLRESSNTVLIVDRDGEAGGYADLYYIATDDAGEVSEIGLVGTFPDVDVNALTEMNFV